MQNTLTYRHLVVATAISLLSSSAFANSDENPIQCEFTPSFSCSDASGIIWRQTDLTQVTPAITDSQAVYLTQNTQALSFDLQTGKEKWRISSREDARYFAPVLRQGYIYLASTGGWLEKRKPDTGELIWAVRPGSGWLYPPQILQGQLFSGGQDAVIWSLDPVDGSVNARLPLDQELVMPLLTASGLMIASTFDGRLTAYRRSKTDKDKLETVWMRKMDTVVFDIQIQHNSLIVSDMGGTIHALSIHNGHSQWRQTLHQNALFWNTFDQQRLYSLSAAGELFSLDIQNGRILKRNQFNAEFSRAPIVRNHQLILFDNAGNAQAISIEAMRIDRGSNLLTSNQTRIQK